MKEALFVHRNTEVEVVIMSMLAIRELVRLLKMFLIVRRECGSQRSRVRAERRIGLELGRLMRWASQVQEVVYVMVQEKGDCRLCPRECS